MTTEIKTGQVYEITKRDASGQLCKPYRVYVFAVQGKVVRTVRIMNGERTTKIENFTDFHAGVNLGSAVLVGDF